MPTAGVKFWRELSNRYNLVGKKCGNCGSLFFPPRSVCTSCGRDSIGKMLDYRFEGRGEVVSYTIVHSSTRDFDFQVPYILAIIKLQDGPLITSQVVYCEPDDAWIGMPVEMVFRRIGEEPGGGVLYYGYKFKPVSQKCETPEEK
jgi:uncharacterized OB-fold protein